MVWEPFALAIVMGLLVSAAIYFIVMWPQVEPEDPADAPAVAAEPDPADADEEPAGTEPSAAVSSDS